MIALLTFAGKMLLLDYIISMPIFDIYRELSTECKRYYIFSGLPLILPLPHTYYLRSYDAHMFTYWIAASLPFCMMAYAIDGKLAGIWPLLPYYFI